MDRHIDNVAELLVLSSERKGQHLKPYVVDNFDLEDKPWMLEALDD